MSYPSNPTNYLGLPGQPENQKPSSLPYPPYPSGSIGQPGFPLPSAYPPSQPSYPQQSPYPQGGLYPPQQPSQFIPQPGQYVPNPSMYPPSSYQPQVSPYPSVQQSSNYPPQSLYPPTQQASSVYPNKTADSYGGHSQVPPQASYPNVLQPSNHPPQSLYPPTQHAPSVYPNTTADVYGGHSQHPPQASNPSINTHQPLDSSHAQKKCNPTVRPANPFDAQHDAEILRKAMKGFGTDEKAIIQVLTHRVNVQRLEIAEQFKTMYGKDLISDLKSELSGKFEDLVIALMTPIHDFLAKELRHAVAGIGTNEETIIEIMCTSSNAEINKIKMSYRKVFKKDLERDLKDDTSGHFRRLLVSLCQANRSENSVVDVASARVDAQNLFNAGEAKFGTDESTFNMILCSRSFCQLQQIFLEYHRLTGRNFEDVIKSEFSGDIENGLTAIVKSVKDKSSYFAKRLHESIAGLGTNDRALIRIVATRCEIDMLDIKNAYRSMYGKSLEADIAGDTSGDYKKCLTALVVG